MEAAAGKHVLTPKWQIAALAIAGAITLFAVLDAGGRRTLSAESADNACTAAQVAVEDRLHARGLDFVTDCNDNSAKKQPQGYWAVGGKVDDKNGTRWLWLVKLNYTGQAWPNGWQVDDVQMEPAS